MRVAPLLTVGDPVAPVIGPVRRGRELIRRSPCSIAATVARQRSASVAFTVCVVEIDQVCGYWSGCR